MERILGHDVDVGNPPVMCDESEHTKFPFSYLDYDVALFALAHTWLSLCSGLLRLAHLGSS